MLARKTRVKKKAELETLRRQVSLLEAENRQLKGIVNQKLPIPVRGKLLQSCKLTLPTNVTGAIQSLSSNAESSLASITDKLNKSNISFCITNPKLPRHPIIYASPAFAVLTGYPLEEVIGKNCSFLQGLATDKNDVYKYAPFDYHNI